jgi:hypothetical protein
MNLKNKYKSDLRIENPSLHLLYVKWAVQHLTCINKAIVSFAKFGNFNMNEVIIATAEARDNLIKNNAAYADASEIIESINKYRNKKSK